MSHRTFTTTTQEKADLARGLEFGPRGHETCCLTRSLALELADRRIRVNCVAPDVIPTGGEVDLGEDGDALARADVARQPWPDDGEPDDVAAAVVFLAGSMSRFVTGASIHVDGGNWASGGWRRDADGRYVL